MGLIDTALGSSSPVACYMYPEPTSAAPPSIAGSEIFIFQYWPQTLQIAYEPTYAEHDIPGSTHPLYQWVGGKGRTISFEAIFTSERDQSAVLNFVPAFLTPSSRYTVDVAAAIARLQGYMMPTYSSASSLNGNITPPSRLILAFPGTGLGGGGSPGQRGGNNRPSFGLSTLGASQTYDAVTVLLFSAPITIESWFPDGAPRVATVQLTFKEVIQRNSGGATSISYVGATPFKDLGKGYHYDGRLDSISTAGSG